MRNFFYNLAKSIKPNKPIEDLNIIEIFLNPEGSSKSEILNRKYQTDLISTDTQPSRNPIEPTKDLEYCMEDFNESI